MQPKHRKRLALLGLVVLLAVLAAGCVPGDGTSTQNRPAGFFWGVWHGWVAPVSLIISIFKPDAGIYEVYNTGLGYDLGFYMAIISGFGGLALSRRKKRD